MRSPWITGMLLPCTLMLACAPNIVLGTRAPDAGQTNPEPDAARPDAGAPETTPLDAGASGTGAPQATPPAAGECTSAAQCRDREEPHCDTSKGECVECLRDADCEATERCESDGECETRPIPCTSAAACRGSDKPICHPDRLECTECVTDDDCEPSEQCEENGECD